MIEILSIDLSNHCSKGCCFCYNGSKPHGQTIWKPEEVISFALDCIAHGVKAISLGGGEPLEYDGIFDIIEVLNKRAFVSVTSNGLPLDDGAIRAKLIMHAPDKLHISIHFPDNRNETDRVIRQIEFLNQTTIIPGVNLIVSPSCIGACRDTYIRLRDILPPKAIILVPLRKTGNKVTPQMLRHVTCGEPFQSTSCLLGCSMPRNFVSVSWDKKAARCSFTPAKATLKELNYAGLLSALEAAGFALCE